MVERIVSSSPTVKNYLVIGILYLLVSGNYPLVGHTNNEIKQPQGRYVTVFGLIDMRKSQVIF